MKIRNRVLATLGAVALMASTVVTGFAETTDTSTAKVNVQVTGMAGATVSVVIEESAANAFDDVTYSYSADTPSVGMLNVTVTDSRGTAAGWNVKVKGTNFNRSNMDVGNDIAIGQLGLVTGAPIRLSSAGTIPTSASNVASVSTSMQQLWNAPSDTGDGQFSLPVTGTLTVPAGTLVDTYTSTITVEIDSAP